MPKLKNAEHEHMNLVRAGLQAAERFICVHYVYKSMSAVVPVRVPRKIAEKVKELVDAGVYPNRSILIREALRRLIVSEAMAEQKSSLGKVAAAVASVMIAWNEKSVTDVILFGSVARGEVTAESDVDLLILVDNAEGWVVRRRLYDLIYPIIPALGVDISLIVLDKKRFISMVEEGDPFAFSVISEGKQLHGGVLDECGKGAFGKGR